MSRITLNLDGLNRLKRRAASLNGTRRVPLQRRLQRYHGSFDYFIWEVLSDDWEPDERIVRRVLRAMAANRGRAAAFDAVAARLEGEKGAK